jgi:hypothetical protein
MSHDTTQTSSGREASRFDYFLVQSHVAARGETTVVRLTVEDLSSGEKHVFESIREFSHFLNQLVEPIGDAKWAPARTDGSDHARHGNTHDSESPRGHHE